MRIFCAVRHSANSERFHGGLWSANFYPALRSLGHEIVESQVDLTPTSRFMGVAAGFTAQEHEMRALTTEKVLLEVKAALERRRVDLFLSYFYNSHFEPAGFDELRRMEIPSVNFYCNSIYQFQNVAAIAAKTDFSWHVERDARPLYHAAGANPVWVQMGADPNVYRPVQSVVRQNRACFAGQRYADRDRWLMALLDAGVPVDIYGSEWGADDDASKDAGMAAQQERTYLGRRLPAPGSLESYWNLAAQEVRTRGPVRGLRRLLRQARYRRETRAIAPRLRQHAKGWAMDVTNLFASYDLSLNFSNVWADGRPGSALIAHVRLRDFEAPMCGACYLTGHTDEIAEFFEIGREIDTYRTREEIIDKSRFYLSNPDAAGKLRQAGYRRAVNEHTWRKRFERLFELIGL